MKKRLFIVAGLSVVLVGCATMYSAAEYDKMERTPSHVPSPRRALPKKSALIRTISTPSVPPRNSAARLYRASKPES